MESRETQGMFEAGRPEEVLWYATRPLRDAIAVNGGERTVRLDSLRAGEHFVLENDEESPDAPRVFQRLLMPVCRQQRPTRVIVFNAAGLKTGGLLHVADDYRIFELPRRMPSGARSRKTTPGRYCLFGDLAPGAHGQPLQRDGTRTGRTECFVKLRDLVVPADADGGSSEHFTVLIPWTGELASLLPDTLVIRLDRRCLPGVDAHGD